MNEKKKAEESLNRKRAVDLLELARKHLGEYGVTGAIQHVYQRETDCGLPWAEEAWSAAQLAVDNVLIARGVKAIPNDEAQREGPGIFDEAIRNLRARS